MISVSYRLAAVLLLLLWLLTILPCGYAAPPFSITTPALVEEVTDVDTVKLKITFTVKLRVEDVDGYEKSTRKGKRAMEALKEDLEGKMVVAKLNLPSDPDTVLGYSWSFERWVGDIYKFPNSRKSLRDWIIENGYEKPESKARREELAIPNVR